MEDSRFDNPGRLPPLPSLPGQAVVQPVQQPQQGFRPAQRPQNQALLNRLRPGGARNNANNNAQAQQAPVQVQPQAPLRPRVAPPQRGPSRFRTIFSAEALKDLRDDADRGKILGMGKGVGDFKQLLGPAAALTLSGANGEAAAITDLLTAVDNYCTDERRQSYEEEKARGAKGDKVTITKFEKAREMRREALRLREDPINVAFPRRLDEAAPDRPRQREGHAEALAGAFGIKASSAGSSVVKLIKNAEDQVAYAFKSIEGETTQTTMEAGGATMRELMVSTLGDAIRGQTGLDFGFPAVTMATLEGKPGALIEGLPGECMDVEGARKELSEGLRTNDENQALYAKWEQAAQAIAPRELQKVMLCGLAMGNLDIKWGNMMVQADGSARPFDAGTAFPSACDMANALDRGVRPDALTMTPNGTPLPSAQQPMDAALVQQFRAIDPVALRAAMAAARTQAAQASGLPEALVDDEEIDRTLQSITIVKDILDADPTINMNAFALAYTNRMQEMVSQEARDIFTALDAENTRRFQADPRGFAAEFRHRMAALQG